MLKFITCFSALFLLVSCSSPKVDNAYAQKLHASKAVYPFEKWKGLYAQGLTQYTESNCNACKQIFDDLIEDLIDAGENARAEAKLSLFKEAILKTNALNERCGYALIETGEREELCALTDSISRAAGLDPGSYSEGEGVASEWRDW